MSDNEKTTDVAVKDATVHRMDGLMPVTWQDKYDMGVMLIKSQMLPSSLDTPAKVFIALQMGHELGLSPMMACNNITAINGKASLSADLIVALCRKHPDFVAMEQSYNPEQGATVTIRTRDGRTYSSTVYAPRGAAILGIDWTDVESKYRTLVPFAKLSSQKIEASIKVIRNFRDVKNVREIVDLLR